MNRTDLQEKAKIRGAVRVRPFTAFDAEPHNFAFDIVEPDMLRERATEKEHRFDAVFGPSALNSDIFEELAMPLVDGFVRGFNGWVHHGLLS